MRKLTIGDVTITSIIERDGPWRAPGQMFPDAPAEQIEATLKELEPETYDVASGKMVITYQTYVVRTPRHTIWWIPARVRIRAIPRRWISRSSLGLMG